MAPEASGPGSSQAPVPRLVSLFIQQTLPELLGSPELPFGYGEPRGEQDNVGSVRFSLAVLANGRHPSSVSADSGRRSLSSAREGG